jgi:hypothetical protein
VIGALPVVAAQARTRSGRRLSPERSRFYPSGIMDHVDPIGPLTEMANDVSQIRESLHELADVLGERLGTEQAHTGEATT